MIVDGDGGSTLTPEQVKAQAATFAASTQKANIDKQVKAIGGSKESQELVRQILTEQAKADATWAAAGGTEGIIAGLSGLGTMGGAGSAGTSVPGTVTGTVTGATSTTGVTETGGPTLARDTFINTLAILMGSKEEASKPYVTELYKLVSGFYKTGSSIQDSINLALYQAKENNVIPEFTNRFSGIFALQQRRAKGEAIDVPTFAEYVKSQQRLGDILRRSGLGDLANETFLNTVMATGKSVDENTEIITDIFDLIDNAPADLKAQISKSLPTVSRTELAKALLTGTEGVKQLERTVKKAGVIAAGASQGLSISDELASNLVSKGRTYDNAGAQFAKVAQILPRAQQLMSFESGLAPEKAYTTEQAVSATFDQNAAELQRLADLAERERARLSGSSGTIGSKSLASRVRGAGLI